MILPTIISISEDSLRALPPTYKAGALPSELHTGKRSGGFWCRQPDQDCGQHHLGMGRAIGETMAMIMILEMQ
jgi:phosphate transport system permease protein